MITYETGTFLVDSAGQVLVDFLFDGGWFKGELGIFSLEGMEDLEPGSTEFMLEAAQRVASNSSSGHVVIQDPSEGARFSADLGYEPDFNRGEYQNVKTFEMTPDDEVAFMLVPNTSFEATLENPDRIQDFGRMPLVSIPEANLGQSLSPQVQFVDINGSGAIGVADSPLRGANSDYNDLIYQVQGLEAGSLPQLEDKIDPDRDWRATTVGQQLIDYTNSLDSDEIFEPEVTEEPVIEGVIEVGDTGEVIVDYLFDGGFFQGEVGMFSLEGLNIEDFGSDAVTEEIINRVRSNSNLGHIILQDARQGAVFDGVFEWESNFNRGEYAGKQTFLMNPEDTLGVVLVDNGSFDGLLEDSSTANLLFSIPEANINDQQQAAVVTATENNAIVSFEDTLTRPNSPNDYNDVILSFEQAQAIGLPAIEDVIASDRNWLDTDIGGDIQGYFENVVVGEPIVLDPLDGNILGDLPSLESPGDLGDLVLDPLDGNTLGDLPSLEFPGDLVDIEI